MSTDLPAVLADAKQKREYCHSIFVGQHRREVQREDTIALSLYSRCLQCHEAIEILVSRSLVDDAWVLLRAMIEHSINCAYMLLIADAQTASDFADYDNYTNYEYLQSIKSTDERAFRHQVPLDVEEKAHARYEQVRFRYDSRRGMDKWCPDGALWKRADLVDKYIKSASPEEASPFLWLAILDGGWRATTPMEPPAYWLIKCARKELRSPFNACISPTKGLKC
jgi:hypothetical protein